MKQHLKTHIEFVAVVHIDRTPNPTPNYHEFLELAHACKATIAETFQFKQPKIHPATFLNTGKLEKIKNTLLHQNSISVILFNHTLSPTHQRNIEENLQCRILDRNGLILEIFAQRARSYEGKLQVELAQLMHLSNRLVRFWTHLERQKGGIGLRGPGETQLETDKRLIQTRIEQLNKKIKKIKNRRTLQRYHRSKNQMPIISLIGYTSAGKSTLFNTLTKQKHYTDQMLFSTLDPTIRQIHLKGAGKILISDTVGFISDLPTELILAFRSTLEEIENSDLILHLIDRAHPNYLKHIQDVNKTLSKMNTHDIPIIMVMNKIDQLKSLQTLRKKNQNPDVAHISAKYHQGIDQLSQKIAEQLHGKYQIAKIQVPQTESKLIAQFHQIGEILSEKYDKNYCIIQIKITHQSLEKMYQQYPKAIKII